MQLHRVLESNSDCSAGDFGSEVPNRCRKLHHLATGDSALRGDGGEYDGERAAADGAGASARGDGGFRLQSGMMPGDRYPKLW